MQRLIEAGEITAEEAEVSERRNIILQALGPEAAIKVDITRQQLRQGDTLVLCSDGLSGLVRDFEIAEAVAEEPDLRALCARLIATANSNGGPGQHHGGRRALRGRRDSPWRRIDDEVGHQAFPRLRTNDDAHAAASGRPAAPHRSASMEIAAARLLNAARPNARHEDPRDRAPPRIGERRARQGRARNQATRDRPIGWRVGRGVRMASCSGLRRSRAAGAVSRPRGRELAQRSAATAAPVAAGTLPGRPATWSAASNAKATASFASPSK